MKNNTVLKLLIECNVLIVLRNVTHETERIFFKQN
jgi:hypothetical protein